MEATSEVTTTKADKDQGNAIVCYCYRLTTNDILDAHKKYGSVKAMEEATRVGQGCAGCKVLIQELCGEIPSDINRLDEAPKMGTSCAKPGSRMMKGFIIANGAMESSVYSSNAVAPQLGECNSTADLEYFILNSNGEPIIHRKQTVLTNETFIFDTRNENLPRPFFGTFVLMLDRSNYGASRFNIYWSNDKSITTTHENASTGRPRVRIPFLFTSDAINGVNDVHLALLNPHHRRVYYSVTVHDVTDSSRKLVWNTHLDSFCSAWVNATDMFLRPALATFPDGKFALKIETSDLSMHEAITVYFFNHNKATDLWNCNHL